MEEWRRRQAWGDIDCSKDWKTIQKITKGWSTDTKYKIVTRQGETLLLRLADIGKYDEKKKSLILLRSIRKQGFPCQCPLNLAYVIRIKVYI